MRARKTAGTANFQPSPSEALLQNMAVSGGKGIVGGSLITASGGAFNINVAGHANSQSHSQDPRPASLLPIMQGVPATGLFVQNLENQVKSNEVNSNYGIGANAKPKNNSGMSNQSLFNIGTQSAKNLGQFPGTTKQQPSQSLAKNITSVPKILADGNFKINLTSGQDMLNNNSRRSGLFKIKNGPEQKGAPTSINNLILKQKQGAKSITSQVAQNLVASPLTAGPAL